VPEQLPTALEVRYEIEVAIGLETKLEADEEGGIEGSLEDLAFSDGMGNFLLGHNLLLGKDLHRVYSLGVPLADLEHLAEGPAPDELEELEVSRG